ncbi:hypothetical protein NGM33_21860 [Nocardiopsis dassonvillei]|uniref:hypothetical protein n=1 Tax=Nocardiopsis dassonvillei TaxID=2014 RepID=UPI00102B80D9|nr:hypothetical protein [Nocardiopsis dassonvillei]MCP3015977.1 hypothetical protein [Nocardiopsis dassonvillei]
MEANRTRPLRDRPDLEAVLRTGLDLIEPVVPALRHRLVGTAAACLQGGGLPVGDVDLLLARREDVDAVAEALAGLECVVAPRWIEPSRPYFACYDLDGVGFSFSTVEQPCDDCGWECRGPGPWRHHVAVDVGGHRVDCVRLELRLVTEFLRGRPDRYRPVLAHLGEHGADLRLLRRSMVVCGVPEEFVERTRGLRAHDGP